MIKVYVNISPTQETPSQASKLGHAYASTLRREITHAGSIIKNVFSLKNTKQYYQNENCGTWVLGNLVHYAHPPPFLASLWYLNCPRGVAF